MSDMRERYSLLNFIYDEAGVPEVTCGSREGTAADAVSILRRFTGGAGSLFIVLDDTHLFAVHKHGDQAVNVELFDHALERRVSAVCVPSVAEIAINEAFSGSDPRQGLEASSDYYIAGKWKPDREYWARRSADFPRRPDEPVP